MRLVALDMTCTQVCPLANSFHDYYFFIHFDFKSNNNELKKSFKIYNPKSCCVDLVVTFMSNLLF